MSEKPPFNPNKPYKEIGTTDVAEKPPFNPNKPFKGVLVTGMKDFGSDKLNEQANPDEILDNIQDVSDNERQVLKNLALKVNEGKAKHEDLRDAILVFQGQHQDQGGEKNYFIEKNNDVYVPKPLAKGQKMSKNDRIVNVFNDSNWYEDLGNSFAAGAEKLGASILRSPAFVYDVAAETGEDLLFKMNPELKPIYEKAGLLKGTPSEQMSESLGLPKENTWAKALEDRAKENKATIVQKYDKGITDYISQGDYGKAIASIGNSIAESLPTTLSLIAGNAAGLGMVGSTLVGTGVFGAGEKQEMVEEGSTLSEGKQNLVALGSGLAEGLFEQFGITKLGLLFKKTLAESGEKEAKRILLSGFKDAYRPTLSKLGIVSEESLGEAATQFTQNALQKYSGNKPDLDLTQGVADAFIVGGVMGGGFSLAGSNIDEVQKRKVDKINEQNKVLFDVVKDGKQAIDAFKADIYNGVRNKKISQEDADKAIVKISAYNDYNQMLIGYELNDKTKEELFDLSFKKQELVNSLVEGIKGKNLEDLNPIEQAKYKANEKIAKGLQDKITDIITGLEVIKDSNVADKTIESVAKTIGVEKKEGEKKIKLTPVQQALSDKYKKDKEVSKKEYPKHELSYEDTPAEQFNALHPREIHRVLSESLDKKEGKSTSGTVLKIPYDKGKNSIFTVEMGDGKEIQFSSSRIREDKWKNGHLMNATDKSIMKKEGEYMVIDRDKLENKPVALKLYTIENDGRKKNAIKIYNPENGKFIAWAKETKRGKNDFTHKEINGEGGLIDAEKTIEPPINPPTEEGGVTVTPKKPTPTQPKGSGNVKVPTKDEYVANQIEALKTSDDNSYDENSVKSGFYERYFTKQYEKQYGKTESADTSKQEKSESRDVEKTDGESESKGKEIKLRTGKKRILQKIKSEARRKAVQWEVTTPYHVVLQYFAGKGTIASAAIGELYGKKKNDKGELIAQEEKFKRNPYLTSAEKTKKGTESLDALANTLWTDNSAFTPNATTEDYKLALEEAIGRFNTRNQMAEALNKAMEEGTEVQRFESEEAMNKYYEQMEAYEDEGNAIVDNLEMYSDAYLEKLANDQAEFEKWEKENDAEIRNDVQDDVESALRKIKKQDEEDNKDRFQQGTERSNEDISKVVERIKKVLPNVKVVYDETLKAKGKWSPKTKTLTINPYFATKDTAIHEAGHILIDAMGGTNNRVIKAAIKQLEGTKLWKETAKAYPITEDYTIDDLGKEVLAEAIGREGAGIFDSKVEESKFKTYLNYIFDWLKRNLGLEKNIAKNLAKQIIGGVGTKNLTGTNTGKEQFQKNKEKEIEELNNDLNSIEEQIDEAEDEETISELESVRDIILERIETLEQEAEDFKKGIVKVKEVADAEDLTGFTLDDLIAAYNDAVNYDGWADKEMLDKAKRRIAYYLNQTGKERLREMDKDIDAKANQKDLKWGDIWFKTLGHISQDFPELQEFYKIFNTAFLDMQTERAEKKSQLEKLGKAVIAEHNKKLGVTGRALNLITSNSAKYFEYLDDNGKFRTSTAGLSKAQIDLLNFMKKLVKDRKEGDVENEILKIDRGFKENWKELSLMDAISQYMGGNNSDVEITVNGKKTTYKDAQKAILNDAKKGILSKVVALPKLLQIAYKAKKGSEKSNYGLNYNGQLTSKFDQPRDKDKGYSKDFYNAAMQFIDDQSHITHMGKLVPLVDSIEQFYKYLGFEQGKSFGNVMKFVEQWKNTQIYQRDTETDPILDKTLQFFRRLTSQVVMGFNYPAAIINVAIGNYNNWRAESASLILKGNKRMFGKGGVNKFGIDFLNKFNVVNQDFDSNPKAFAGKLFDMMAFGATRFGEYQIQGSMFLGQLTDEEWNSLEYKDGELQLKKGVNEKAFKNKMNQYKDRVSDIQGKYSEKDRRNFMRFEAGKSASQFKVWVFDFIKERFGNRYIDANNIEHVGSWRTFTEQSFTDLRKQMKTKEFWTSKQMQSNLKGAMTVAVLMIAVYGGDDDKKKRRQALSLENALGNMLFLLDPEQLKYMLKSPVASIGTVEKFVTALEDLMKGDVEKFEKDVMKVIPYNKAITQTKELTK